MQCPVQQSFIIPGCFSNQMAQALMHASHMIRIQPCGHVFNAFPLSRQKQSRAVRLKRSTPVSMSRRLRLIRLW